MPSAISDQNRRMRNERSGSRKEEKALDDVTDGRQPERSGQHERGDNEGGKHSADCCQPEVRRLPQDAPLRPHSRSAACALLVTVTILARKAENGLKTRP